MRNPERIYQVRDSQLSIARYYGGIRFCGDYYVYDPLLDVLIREDVLKAEAREAKEKRQRLQEEWEKKQLDMLMENE